tara:strand:- start:1437 stop:1952 length:516 start_codon:yes stop_codon:yes gene_type:complete
MNKNSKQYNRSVSYKKKIAFSVNDVWKIISTPSNLELFHPFCLKNTVEKWPGENSKDSIEYYNGMILNRTFVNWIKNEGYDLFIGRKNGSLSFVSWRIKKVSDNSCTIKISVYPHKYNMGSKFLNFIPFFFFIYPIIKKYLKQVIFGLDWHLQNRIKIPKNQFGNNFYFSK